MTAPRLLKFWNVFARPLLSEHSMKLSTQEKAARLLADLVAIPSVNPMGRPYNQAHPVERPVVEYLERFFSRYGVDMQRQAYSPTHENLFILVPGRVERPWTLFESHMDTVPADDWLDRAFQPVIKENLLFGRGACDDK